MRHRPSRLGRQSGIPGAAAGSCSAALPTRVGTRGRQKESFAATPKSNHTGSRLQANENRCPNVNKVIAQPILAWLAAVMLQLLGD